ncbi:MAG: siroheme synthase CysG [Filomicrobium sp.]
MQIASRKPSEAGLSRIKPLAKLPLFYDLSGKRVVLAGGSAAAAWKAELIAAAGAEVEIYADHLDDEMSVLIARGSDAGKFVHHARPWNSDIFHGAALALADAASDAEAKAFYCAARAASVPVNVIDKPAFCEFQFGSIVNRSPVVIGISTDGAAPVLGQAIRRRIETLLPSSLASWAALAKDIRKQVASLLPSSQQRRAFWESFSDRAFTQDPTPPNHDTITRLIGALSSKTKPKVGKVTLVGAGPGDPELLTLKAVRALQSADVILFDDLVSDGVLELARREAKRMMVGKRGQRASCRQDDINDLMIKLAKQGKHVVRLKSGDPMIFGRAGEEMEQLEAADIPVAVVPGISAAVALASELGLSLTHRDFAHSVRFVTGHSRAGQLPSHLDWRGLADPQTTLLFYMGGRTAPQIAERLMAEGLTGNTPTVVATDISRPSAMKTTMTLSDLGQRGALPTDSPVLIGIGTAFHKEYQKRHPVSEPAEAQRMSL